MTKTRNVIKSADFAVLVLLWLAKNSRMFICITQFVSFAWNRAHITMMMVMMIVLFINQLEASYRIRSSNLLFMLSASQKQHGPREKLNMKHKWCFFNKYQTLIFSLFFCLNLDIVVKYFRWQWFFKNEQKECKSASHENGKKANRIRTWSLLLSDICHFHLKSTNSALTRQCSFFEWKNKSNEQHQMTWPEPYMDSFDRHWYFFSISEWFNILCFLLT